MLHRIEESLQRKINWFTIRIFILHSPTKPHSPQEPHPYSKEPGVFCLLFIQCDFTLNKSPACECQRSHRNWSIFQIYLKTAIISKAITGAMTRTGEAGTSLPCKPCLLKKVVKTKHTPNKNPTATTNLKPSTITLNRYQFLRCLFPLSLLLSQCPIWIYCRIKVFHFHILCFLSFSPSLNALEKIPCWDDRCWVRKELNRGTAAVSLWTVCIWDRAGQMSFCFYINTELCTLHAPLPQFWREQWKMSRGEIYCRTVITSVSCNQKKLLGVEIHILNASE